MKRKNTDNILMFSEAIASNGYKVLVRPKFIKYIAKTEILKFPNGLGKITWIDHNGDIVAEHTGALDDTVRYPRIGEVVEVN